ncbi:hypothetical protein MTsPCn9_00140 [Croceitalea sp. MTPC9]|uniref:hypothetical protein n=1 Tax=unclassified Croceitalea TaxID=2632280 RepID=UPI002B3D9A35|nr:hypothetical protein MTsPCn6_08570 [Croceitalea sp. MTPC6]GMN15078.1 hypothetical protein MTsPCn9_00140 [Croceitalea sp. MTPC9]
MTTFFSILFVLLAINAVLLIFSVNGPSKKVKRPLQKLTGNSVPKLFSEQYSDRDYKKAV